MGGEKDKEKEKKRDEKEVKKTLTKKRQGAEASAKQNLHARFEEEAAEAENTGGAASATGKISKARKERKKRSEERSASASVEEYSDGVITVRPKPGRYRDVRRSLTLGEAAQQADAVKEEHASAQHTWHARSRKKLSFATYLPYGSPPRRLSDLILMEWSGPHCFITRDTEGLRTQLGSNRARARVSSE